MDLKNMEWSSYPHLTHLPTQVTMADARKEPTAAEAMLFFSIVKHTRNKADVDWEAVATEAGFKNADVAKVSTSLPLLAPS
ncbi:hypothetical protein NM208_g16519 [Fusarium decemcellulare]|uniref:Uncharacterized protein n=1 Tax=Fusarium decemcellulare TaxID=57161 RepID=A0ACC1RCI7_9HYPO|nr:hypothetical protein NM208_g16519 [Fusarium decemcellulare]